VDSRIAHQTTGKLVELLGGQWQEAAIYSFDMRRSDYCSRLVVRRSDEELTVDCSVADAIAMSLVSRIALKVSSAFLFKPPSAAS
jgi:hypothetical protein